MLIIPTDDYRLSVAAGTLVIPGSCSPGVLDGGAGTRHGGCHTPFGEAQKRGEQADRPKLCGAGAHPGQAWPLAS